MLDKVEQIKPQLIQAEFQPEKAVVRTKTDEDVNKDIQDELGQLHDFALLENAAPAQDTKVESRNYFESFIQNKLVADIFPNIANQVNIWANGFSMISSVMGFNEKVQDFSKNVANAAVKAFMICNSVTSIVERVYSKNYLMALGFLNDIGVASLVGLDNLYLARGCASGTYNLAEALNCSNDKDKFENIGEHLSHVKTAFAKFSKNLFSKNVLANFKDSENAMFASFGGILSNIGTGLWMLSGKTKLPTVIRDIGGVLMDVEQLNPGHYKAGKKNFFFSGIALVIGTISDLFARLMPKYKNIFTPLTFIGDGIGRHLLRLHQNAAQGLDETRKNRSEELALQSAA